MYRNLSYRQVRVLAKARGDKDALSLVPEPKDIDTLMKTLRISVHEGASLDQEWWPMDKQALSHRKNFFGLPGNVRSFSKWGPCWQPGLALAWSLLPSRVRRYVDSIFRYLGLYRLQNDPFISKSLKMLTKIAKKGKLMLSRFWIFLVDWQNLGGMHGHTDIDNLPVEFIESAKSFGQRVPRPVWWDKIYGSKVAMVVEQWPWRVRWEEILSPRDFIAARRLWATPGVSSTEFSGEAEVEGKPVTLKGSKWNLAVSLTVDELLDIIMMHDEQAFLAKPFSKIEVVYRDVPRVVTTSSLSLYLNMALVFQVYHRAFHGDPRCVAWSGNLAETLIPWANGETKASIDQSAFDQHVTKEDIFSFIDRAEAVALYKWGTNDANWFVEANRRIRRLLESTNVQLGDENFKWINGVMSGWLFTSMLDSVSNLAQQMAISEFAGIRMPKCIVQGDDYLDANATAGDSVCKLLLMPHCGLEAKPGDTTIALEGELVRFVFSPGKIEGYPIRSVPSAVWRAEPTKPENIGLMNMRESIGHYCTFVSRGLEQMVAKDFLLKQLIHIGGDDAINWARTPRTLGGGGLLELGPLYVVWVNEEDEYFSNISGVKVADDLFKYNPSSRQVQQIVSKLVSSRKAKWTVQRGSLKRSKESVVPEKLMPVSDTHRHRSAVFKFEATLSLDWDNHLRQLVEDRNYEEIYDLLDRSCCADMSVLQHNSNRRVLDAWILGRLPIGICASSKLNDALISDISQGFINAALSKMFILHKIRWTNVLQLFCSAEVSAYDAIVGYSGILFTQ